MISFIGWSTDQAAWDCHMICSGRHSIFLVENLWSEFLGIGSDQRYICDLFKGIRLTNIPQAIHRYTTPCRLRSAKKFQCQHFFNLIMLPGQVTINNLATDQNKWLMWQHPADATNLRRSTRKRRVLVHVDYESDASEHEVFRDRTRVCIICGPKQSLV